MEKNTKNDYTGVRYLVGTYDSREFAVTFDKGLPVDIKVFNGTLKPNESILAYDDDARFTLDTKRQEGLLDVVGFEIKTGDTAKPKKLKMRGYEYDAKPAFAANGQLSTVFSKRASINDPFALSRAPQEFRVPATGGKIENPCKKASIARASMG
ncbi:MAG: hypothetical protein GC185_12420 [Alphaproteobacteria bacterium]|nr:hypothetical protein [Alphaproteobacteria bacterium]